MFQGSSLEIQRGVKRALALVALVFVCGQVSADIGPKPRSAAAPEHSQLPLLATPSSLLPARSPGTGSEGDKGDTADARERSGDGAHAKSDFLPVDPAEQRPPVLPPPRPDARAVLVGGNWVSLGPAPTYGGQVSVPPDDEVSGAVQAIAVHPVNQEIVYIGAVNGGIWKTINAYAARPSWTPLTDNLPSQSIASIALDPLDASHQTVIAGTGRVSSFGERGDDEVGIYYSSNGGANWTQYGSTSLLGQKLISVAARGQILLAASRNGGLYRSTNGGGAFSLVSGTGNLPAGGVFDLAPDPTNTSRFYVSVAGAAPKVLRSVDSGATWTDVTAGLTGLGPATDNMKLSVGALGTLFLATVNSGRLSRLSRSTNFGANWTAMDVPAIHNGSQGGLHAAIAAHPTGQNLVYLGGDRIANLPFTGNIVVCDANAALLSQCRTTYGGGGANTAPHADSRKLVFDASGNLLVGDDGGIYRRSTPLNLVTGSWSSVIGNLAIMEVHDLAHDRVANVVMIGTQDNGTHLQQTSSQRWLHVLDGDGGDVAIDDLTLGAAGSFRYDSYQNFVEPRRTQYNAGNAFVGVLLYPTIPDPQFVTPIELSVGNPARIMIGGANTVWESNSITGGSPTLVSLGGPGATAIAYGVNGNVSAAYVVKGSSVYVRNGTSFVATASQPAGAQTLTDVAMDPDDRLRVFVIDDNQVFRTTDGGANWQDVTGNLASISSVDFRTIEYIPDDAGDRVALGTRSGVYSVPVTSSTWSLFGIGLPNVLVYDLRYLLASRTLIAGTLGRGVWSAPFPAVNTAPSFTAAATITRQQGSPAGAAVTVGTASDAQSAAGSLVVTPVTGGSATGITIGTTTNSAGSISAPVSANCSATSGTQRFQVSDGSLTNSGDVAINVTPNTPPVLGYPSASIGVGASGSVNPSIPPSDNGTILTIATQSFGTYTGGITASSTTGVITLTNAAPAGTHTITMQIADNCFTVTNVSFSLTVTAAANTAPNFTPAATITRQQGSPAGASVAIGSASDGQTAAGSLTVTQVAGGSATGITIGTIVNNAGTISAPISADCSATSGTQRFQVSDGSLTSTGDLSVNVTPNTSPVLGYANASVGLGAGATLNPSIAPGDNGSILVIGTQSMGTYTGGINASNITGVITLANAAPVGTHTITMQIADNCFVTTPSSFQLTVQPGTDSVFRNGFE